jgi:hypothetical protein
MMLVHFSFRSVVPLNPALPSCKMLIIVFLLAVLGTSQLLVFVLIINTVLLLGAHVCKRSGFSQLHFIVVFLKSLIISKAFYHNPDVLVLCSSYILRPFCVYLHLFSFC